MIKQCLILFLSLFILYSCSESEEIKVNIILNRDLEKCFNYRLNMSSDSSKCIECFQAVVKKYPDSIVPYLMVIDEYYMLNKIDSAKLVQKSIQIKFGNRTEYLFQKNFLMIQYEKKFDSRDLEILRIRKENGDLDEQQEIDLELLEEMISKNY